MYFIISFFNFFFFYCDFIFYCFNVASVRINVFNKEGAGINSYGLPQKSISDEDRKLMRHVN